MNSKLRLHLKLFGIESSDLTVKWEFNGLEIFDLALEALGLETMSIDLQLVLGDLSREFFKLTPVLRNK